MTGPVIEHDSYFWLMIPLEAGGRNFIECSKGVSIVEDGYLKIFIAAPVAEKMDIHDGSLVQIDNQHGKLNIRLAEPN